VFSAIALVIVSLAGALMATACGLDQKPSMFANGSIALINKQTPTSAAQLQAWSYFVFSGHYTTHQSINFREDRAEVSHSLSAEAMRQPIAWSYGDGQAGRGWMVSHHYPRPGRWVVQVFVWDPESGRWDLFDRASIRVT
jgi:PKD domain